MSDGLAPPAPAARTAASSANVVSAVNGTSKTRKRRRRLPPSLGGKPVASSSTKVADLEFTGQMRYLTSAAAVETTCRALLDKLGDAGEADTDGKTDDAGDAAISAVGTVDSPLLLMGVDVEWRVTFAPNEPPRPTALLQIALPKDALRPRRRNPNKHNRDLKAHGPICGTAEKKTLLSGTSTAN